MRRTRRPPRDRASGSAAATHAGAARGLLVLLGAALLGARGGRARLPDADWETLPQVDYEVAAATVEPTSTTTTITTGPPTTPALTRDAPRPDDSGGAIGAQLLKGKLPVRIGLTRGELKAVLTMVSGRLRKEAGELSTNRVNDWDLVLASDAYAKSAVPYVLLLAEQARGNGTGAASCTSRGGEARSHGRDGSTATTTEKNRSALIKKTVAEIQAELKSSRGQNKEQKRVPDLNNISDQLQILSALLTEARKEAEAAQATSTPEPPQPPTVKPSARHPAQPTNPAQPSSQPVQPPAQPGQPLAQPAQPIAQPGQPLAQPVQPPGQPARPMQPAQPPPQPARLPLQPVGRPAPPALPMQPVQSMSTQPTHPTQQGETTHTGSPGQPGQPAWPPPLPGSVPGHATGQAAGQAAGQVQGPQPGHDPGQTLGQAPVLGQAPGHTLGTAPTSAPGHSSSGNSPGLAPGLALPQVPGQTVGHASEPTPVMSGYVPQHEAGSAQSPRPQVFAVPPNQSNPSQAQSPGGLPLSPLPPNTQPSSPQQPANAQPQTLNPVRAQPVGAQPVGAQPLGAQRPWQSQPAQQEHPYQQAQGQSHPYATQHQNHPPAPDSSATPVGAGGPQPQQQGQPSMPMAMSEPPAPSTLPQAPAPQPQPQPNSQLKTQPQPSPQAPQSPQVQAQVQAPAQPQDQPLASLKHPGEVLPPVAGPLRPAGESRRPAADPGYGHVPRPVGSFALPPAPPPAPAPALEVPSSPALAVDVPGPPQLGSQYQAGADPPALPAPTLQFAGPLRVSVTLLRGPGIPDSPPPGPPPKPARARPPAPPLQPPGESLQPNGSPRVLPKPRSPPQSPAGLFPLPGSAAVAGAGAGSPLPTGSFQPVAPAEPSDATPRPSASDALNAAPDFAGSGGSGGAGQGSGSAGHPEYGAGGEPGSRGTPPPPADETTTEGTETPSPLREHIAPIAELSQAFAGLPGMSGLSYGLNEIPGMSTTGDTLGRRLGATAATPVSSSHLGRALQLPDEETPAISQRGQTRTPHPTAGHVTTAPLPRSADSQSTTHSLSGVAHDGFHDLVGEGGNGHKDSDPGPSPVPVRIVNGEDADITDVPYQVALEYWNNFLCGGSIISEWWVLTAAHCIARRTTARLWLVRMGTSLRQKGGRTVRVRQVIPHPSYTSTTHGYDVGLLRLAQRAALGRNVRVVNLSRRGAPDPATGTPAVISGWGSTSFEFGEKASKLQRAQVEVVERANCSAEYNEMGLGPIRADELCAGGKPRDACQGDSGGPMVDLAGVQVGIVSWGAGCATNPGVYTKVGNQDVRDFIRRTAGV